jgi:pyruvate/2-oxoglutarate dehydrogenase complex dihydrolipoamide acyltransferase (E2) component
MDTTASSFTLRKNAKRAAEAMIRKGTAPAVDYGIKPSDNGRFEIVWKIAKAAPTTDEVETEIAKASADRPAAASPTEAASQPAPAATEPATTDAAPQPASEAEAASQPPVAPEAAPALSEPAPIEWPHGTRVMVRKRKSWREATIISRLDPDLWRAEYTGGGSGMFREADIRAYDPERDATTAEQPRRAKATAPQNLSRSRYAIDPETITAGRLPQRAPVVTSAANPHYQKHFDRLFDLAKAGDWDGVRNYEVKGSNSYSKMVARYRQDLLAVHAASEAAP